eukprot:scaffold21.g2214.t1
MQTHTPALWAHLQPPELAAACAEHTALLPGGLPLRNPWLLPFQLGGVAVGLGGRAALGRAAPAAARHRHAYLAHALLFFAGMNLTSIIAHALVARASLTWAPAKALDIAFTGAASACVMLGALAPPPRSASAAAAAAARCSHALVLALSVAAAGELLQLPWAPEACYLGTTLAATAVTFHRTLLPAAAALLRGSPAGTRGPSAATRGGGAAAAAAAARRRRGAGVAAAAAGAACMLAALPADAWLCHALGSAAVGTNQLLFLGSDLAFLGLVLLALTGVPSGGKARK